MLYRAPAVFLALTLHEVAHGYVALLCGDPTAKNMGRLSLNPAKHLDLIGTISMFLMGVGWAKPVPVNPGNFRKGHWDDLKVSLAGVTTNFVLFLIASVFTVLLGRLLYLDYVVEYQGAEFFLNFRNDGFLLQLYPQFAHDLEPFLKTPWLLHVQRFFLQLALVNLGMCLFNLLPIPPLDGFHVVNDLFFSGKINITGKVFRITHVLLMVGLLTTDYVGKWITTALYAVQGAIMPLILGIFPL